MFEKRKVKAGSLCKGLRLPSSAALARWLAIAVVAIVLVALAVIFRSRGNAGYKPLLGAREDVSVTEAILVRDTQNIPCRPHSQSGQLRVSESELGRARILLPANAVVTGLPEGLERVDKSDAWDVSRFVQDARLRHRRIEAMRGRYDGQPRVTYEAAYEKEDRGQRTRGAPDLLFNSQRADSFNTDAQREERLSPSTQSSAITRQYVYDRNVAQVRLDFHRLKTASLFSWWEQPENMLTMGGYAGYALLALVVLRPLLKILCQRVSSQTSQVFGRMASHAASEAVNASASNTTSSSSPLAEAQIQLSPADSSASVLVEHLQVLAVRSPESVADVIKRWLREHRDSIIAKPHSIFEPPLPEMSFHSIECAAIALLSMGEEAASSVLRYLSRKESLDVTQAMARMSGVEDDTVQATLAIFFDTFRVQNNARGALRQRLRRSLDTTLGSVVANSVLNHIYGDAIGPKLARLQWAQPHWLAERLSREQVRMQAIFLALLPPEQASQVIHALPAKHCDRMLWQVAKLKKIDYELLRDLETVIDACIDSLGTQGAAADGMRRVADTINRMPDNRGRTVEEEHSYEFSMLAYQNEGTITTMLERVSFERWGIALKGADASIREVLMRAMPAHQAQAFEDMLSRAPAVPLSRVEQARREIMDQLRAMAAEGEITLRFLAQKAV